jgi:phenylacetate-CoA ligase
LSSQVEQEAGVEQYQIIQASRNVLRVRLQLREQADPDQVWHKVHSALARMLSDHDLDHVVVDRGTEPPELSSGGKLRSVIPLISDGA